MLADVRGDGAIVEADGDEVDLVEGRGAGVVERAAELALEGAALGDGGGGEAGDEEVGCFDGAFDGAGPVLAGEQFAAVDPGIEAGLFETGVELIDGGGVLLGVGEEDGRPAIGDELDAAGGGGAEEADALDLDGVAIVEAALDEAGDLGRVGRLSGGHGGRLSARKTARSGTWVRDRVRNCRGQGARRTPLCGVA